MVKRTVLLDVRITFITFYLFMYIVQFGTATCVFSEDFRVIKGPHLFTRPASTQARLQPQ
jgi:hypothetical protein